MDTAQAPSSVPRAELSDRYFLEAYFGWEVERACARWKLLCRRTRGLARRLLLSDGAPREEIAAALDAGAPRTLVSTVWNDFSATLAAPVRVGRFAFQPSDAARGRWFGVGTYVFDLSLDDDALLAAAQPRVRSKVRSTRRAGYRTDIVERPSRVDLGEFAARHAAMARERGLAPLREESVARMFDQRDAVLVRAIDPRGIPRTWNIVYLTATHGYYLEGVHDPRTREAAGHQLHMDTLGYVRSRGRRYYDFGLVASVDRLEGIHRFKRSFGGLFLPSGVERTASLPGWERAAALVRALRERARAPR